MPKRFVFTMQRVLDYRAQLEEQAKLVLAKAQYRYQSQVRIVQDQRDRLAAHDQAMYSDDEITPNTMWLWRAYKERLIQDLAEAEIRMLDLAQALNKARREAVQRSTDRKLLEKLRETQAKRHEQEEQLAEQKAYDEMATIRYEYQAV